jgi:AraC family transcriptional regulator
LLRHSLADEPPPPDYASRVNRVIDHVLLHLDETHRLVDLAEVAGVSPFHFHRVFRALIGETLQKFVKRLRLERALQMMSHRPRRSLTEIAFACGFSSSSDFTRSFKQRYGVAPSAFDLRAWRDEHREDLRRNTASTERWHIGPRLAAGENPDGFVVQLRDLPPRRVAYIRVLDPFQGTGVMDAYAQLMAWADARRLAGGQWLGYMWEDPEVVALSDCRYDVGVEVPWITRPDAGVSTFDFPAMRVAEVRLAGDLALEQRCLDWLFGTWLPASGHVPDDQPAFEAWVGRPFAHGYEHFELAAQLPVRRE